VHISDAISHLDSTPCYDINKTVLDVTSNSNEKCVFAEGLCRMGLQVFYCYVSVSKICIRKVTRYCNTMCAHSTVPLPDDEVEATISSVFVVNWEPLSIVDVAKETAIDPYLKACDDGILIQLL
jgi:hypothetical protein